MVARINTVAFSGIEAKSIDVQVQIADGMPSFSVVGLADKAVAESRERVRSALHSLGLSLPAKRVTVNLAPADITKEGSHYDLPIALGLMAAMDIIPLEDISGYYVLGELALDSSVLPVAGVLPAAIHANSNNMGLICPYSCGQEAAWAGDMEIIAPKNLLQFLNHIKGTQILSIPKVNTERKDNKKYPDLKNVKGQETAKRALEIAAAGGHNLLFIGPPGTGKSMMSSCLPGILPPLSAKEALEVSMIHSLAGNLPEGGLIRERPYRSPHHSASQPALVGGGQKAKPGEISLAHKGILFLDELPEFARQTLEVLRQPLETGEAVISRANNHAVYPADFQLIAAMNPCKCGYLGDVSMECSKAPKCGKDYLAKLSGPLLDRFDMFVEVPAVALSDLQKTSDGESSGIIAKRVEKAMQIQKSRNGDILNSSLKGEILENAAVMSDNAKELLLNVAEKMKFSARAYHRVLRVARTIADMDEHSDKIAVSHISEAVSYRRAI